MRLALLGATQGKDRSNSIESLIQNSANGINSASDRPLPSPFICLFYNLPRYLPVCQAQSRTGSPL
jgi:hypothetical protein